MLPSMIPDKQSRELWEDQYKSGAWDSLSNRDEFAHYTVVAGFIQQERRPVSLLDVGCGEGVILKYLDLDSITRFTGVDIAQAALDRLQPRRPEDRLICSGLEDFQPDDKWDVILFNEVLYYTRHPVRELRKFENCLNPGGYFVVSMYQKKNPFAYNNRCLRRLRRYFTEARYSILDAIEVRRLLVPCSWHVFVVRP
jgi:2-polyprenyl-3-methyl-5-hydroxy-6-metoxy-1,4-benzoquinol methylase